MPLEPIRWPRRLFTSNILNEMWTRCCRPRAEKLALYLTVIGEYRSLCPITLRPISEISLTGHMTQNHYGIHKTGPIH